MVVHTLRRSYNNVHVVVRGRDAFLVDAGLESDARWIEAELRRLDLDPAQIRAVVVTHGHADHAGGAGHFKRVHGTPVLVGAGDEHMLATGHNDSICPTDAIARRQRKRHEGATYTPLRPDVIAEAPLALEPLTGIRGSVVPLPGHTPGSLVIVLDDAALVGDLFRGTLLGHRAAVHFYMCDLDDNRRDLRALLEDLAPRAQVFFTGHFGPVSRRSVERRFPAPAK